MIRVNGAEREGAGATVVALLEQLVIDPRGIAVALDGEIVRRSAWDSTVIEDGSSVEIVTAAAGG
jgi:sulfur carrier protein